MTDLSNLFEVNKSRVKSNPYYFQNVKVLLVEDDAALAQSCTKFLTRTGYIVFHALTGEDGISMYEKHNPDVILLDILLPSSINGYQVAQTIRMHDCNTPIIFISSLTNPENVTFGLELGVNDYMRKELIMEEVDARIQSALRVTRSINNDIHSIRLNDRIVFNAACRALYYDGDNLMQLMPLESIVLKALAYKKNSFVKKETLMIEGWGVITPETSRYLDKVMVQLRRKFKQIKGMRIVTLWGKGYGLMMNDD